MDAPCANPVLFCDVSRARPDAVTVDALARLVMTARGRGYGLRLCNASPELCELIAFMGLSRELPTSVETSR